jgi:hypothetical protein
MNGAGTIVSSSDGQVMDWISRAALCAVGLFRPPLMSGR